LLVEALLLETYLLFLVVLDNITALLLPQRSTGRQKEAAQVGVADTQPAEFNQIELALVELLDKETLVVTVFQTIPFPIQVEVAEAPEALVKTHLQMELVAPVAQDFLTL
jgi:hypothetical protein